MSGRNYKIFVESIFRPLAEAAGRPDLLPHLKTVDVVPERQAEQFKKFRELQADISGVVYLPNGGFAALLNQGEKRLLAISSAGMNDQDEEQLNSWADNIGLVGIELDESTFLFLSHVLSGYYRIKDQYRASTNALEVIDVINDQYTGHYFTDLYDIYRPVFIFEIPENVNLYDKDIT